MRSFLTFSCLVIALPLAASTARASARSGPYAIELIGEDNRVLPTFAKDGRTYVLGNKGERYSVRIRNQSGARVEFVASVDGRDVLDGSPGNWNKRGYIVNPWDQVVIDGFRLDEDRVAAFRFSSVRNSYAAEMGDARDVGVVGVAVFTERPAEVLAAPRQRSYDLQGGPIPPSAPSPATDGLGSAARGEAAPPMETSAKSAMKPEMKKDRGGLGTEFGESRWSHVNQTEFERSSATPPIVLSLRYNDRAGLRAMGVNLHPYVEASEVDVRETAQPFRGNYCTPPAGWNR